MENHSAQTHERLANDVIRLPYGLLGFERVKSYMLLANPDEAPFMWFQMLEEAKRSFLVVTPKLVAPDYDPVFGDSDVEFLALNGSDDAFMLCIVTLKAHGQATVNLKGPIVINRRTLIGKQVIPNNANGFPLKHPLPIS
jgi:flagellar assembly factor FliW